MQTVSLNGPWRMCVYEGGDWIPVQVPGSVFDIA